MNAARLHTDQADDRTKHLWRTVSSSLNHWQGECEKCGASTNNAMLAHVYRDTCPGFRAETAESLAAKLRAINYASPQVNQPTPEQAAADAKEHFGLCVIRECANTMRPGHAVCDKHAEPRRIYLCRIPNCRKEISHPGMCDDCASEDEAGVNPARSTASQLRIIALCVGIVLALALVVYFTGGRP
jgi:hypothetical protein